MKKFKGNDLYLTGEVNDEMVTQVIDFLAYLENGKPIEVHMFTHGGDVYAGLAIYDLFQHVPNEVYILVHGACMSAGTIIIMAADRRKALPNAQFLVHYGTEWNESGLEKEQNERIFKLMKTIMKSRLNVSTRKLNNWFKGETYFDAKEALKVGLIDEIKEKSGQ